MAKLTLNDLASLQNETSAIATINNNNAAIETALENTFSLDGTSPNALATNLDMDSHRILNLPEPSSPLEPLRVIDADDGVTLNITDIGGPLSTTDHAVVRWDGTAGSAIQDSPMIVTDAGIVTGVTDLTITGSLDVGDSDFGLDVAAGGASIPGIVFDSGDDELVYDRANNNYLFKIGGATPLLAGAAVLRPTVNDAVALGAGTLSFSDLFLAEGGVISFDNGDVTVTQSGNSLTVAGGNLIFPGTSTNDSASAGQVGEIVESTVLTGSAVALTTATPANVTSIELTAGDWDVWGSVWFSPVTSTSITVEAGAISTTSATLPTSPGGGARFNFIHAAVVPGNGALWGWPIGQTRISVASTTTVYLIAQATFTAAALSAYGYIGARRVR